MTSGDDIAGTDADAIHDESHLSTLIEELTPTEDLNLRSPRLWLQLLGPFCGFLIYLAIYTPFLGGEQVLSLLGLILAYVVPPAGKETLIPLGVATLQFQWWQVALTFVLFDLAVGLFLVTNYGHAKRLPLLGPWIEKFEVVGAKKLHSNRVLRRLGTVGLVLFMIVPFQGSGTVSSSILGRALGFSPVRILTVVAGGSTVSSMVISFAAYSLSGAFLPLLRDPRVLVPTLALVIGVIITFVILFRRTSPTPEGDEGPDTAAEPTS